MSRILLFVLILFTNDLIFSQLNANPQEAVKSIGKYKYQLYSDGKYYTTHEGLRGNLVDLEHLIVKLKDDGDMTTFDYSKHSLPKMKIIRDRFAGGYYELLIPEGISST